MVAGLIVGFGLALCAVIIGFFLGRSHSSKEQTRLLTIIDSRLAVLGLRVEKWMKHATTLPAMPAVRSDPRRDPDE